MEFVLIFIYIQLLQSFPLSLNPVLLKIALEHNTTQNMLSIIIVTTSYFLMSSQISSEFHQIPFFKDILGEPVSCENECYGELLVIFLKM